MKPWVKSFLTIRLEEQYSRWPNKEKKKRIKEQLDCQESRWYELTDCFRNNFGIGLGAGEVITLAFGSVLENLPKEVFETLRSKRNVFYIHTPCDGAEVKVFDLDLKDIKNEEEIEIKIVNFPYASEFMPFSALKGEIVHELAHVYSNDRISTPKNELKIDKLCERWGFKTEIKAIRNYWRELELEAKKEREKLAA